MSLFAEWSARRKRNAATIAPVDQDPAPDDAVALSQESQEETSCTPASRLDEPIGANGTGIDAETDLAVLSQPAQLSQSADLSVGPQHAPVAALPAELKAAFEERAAIVPHAVRVVATCSNQLATSQTADFCGSQGYVANVADPLFQNRTPASVSVDDLPADLKGAFEERAAIAEIDGGLDRAAAERLAWAEINAGPIGDTLQAWRAWMNYRIPVWLARGLSRPEALRSVWAEAEYVWHCRHGAPPDPDRCAGCGGWLLDGPGWRMIDGVVVHFGGDFGLDCQVLYDAQWREAASAGLMALGLKRPQS